MLSNHLSKENLHHAYLIEGERGEVVPEIIKFIEELGIESVGNADVSHISLDSFKIEDARNLKSYAGERGYTKDKKIFIISANSFLLEAQNSLLKMFEEPIENTHFFLILPDASALLKTFVSRFYLISARQPSEEVQMAEKFITMSLVKRIDYIKELITEAETEEDETVSLDSPRAKSLKFLNSLESVLHEKAFTQEAKNSAALTLPGIPGGTYAAQNFLLPGFKQIFKVREFLRMPGSSTKSLMESVALTIPEF